MDYPKRGESIDRHESLRSLSRHHMVALLLALNLRRVGTEKSKSTAKEMQVELKGFWLPEGQEHFRDEEEILLTAYAQYADIDIPEVQDMLIEHVKIRALIDTILKMVEIDVRVMHQLGELLDLHIRKEERILFPMIEQALPEDVLEKIAPSSAIALVEEHSICYVPTIYLFLTQFIQQSGPFVEQRQHSITPDCLIIFI